MVVEKYTALPHWEWKKTLQDLHKKADYFCISLLELKTTVFNHSQIADCIFFNIICGFPTRRKGNELITKIINVYNETMSW